MDYEKLAAEFMDILPKLLQIPMQKDADRLVRGEMFALRYLFEEGPQTPGKISEKMNISTARTAKLLAVLEAKGFLVRVPDGADKRKSRVTLTEKGVRHIAAHRKLFLRMVTDMMKALGEHDALEYVRITRRVLENATVGKEERVFDPLSHKAPAPSCDAAGARKASQSLSSPAECEKEPSAGEAGNFSTELYSKKGKGQK